ncbi:hypothetical protein [Solibacillus isronensis]|uniref:hypothetical protein n=1 Tax=Solibacillus isronensis TaxID=412383 RepID=UPI0009A5E3F7|nr:hypothetical protein [Solibacillus isronensis]
MKINSGYLDYFYVLSSDEILEKDLFIDYIHKIVKDPLRISIESADYKINFHENFEKEIEERFELCKKANEKGEIISPILKKSIKLPEKIEITSSGTQLLVSHDGEDRLLNTQLLALERLAKLLNMERFYTGNQSKDTKNRFIIRPPEILNSNEVYIPTIMLTIYKNGKIIIHFSLFIEDVDVFRLSGDKWDITFDEILFPEKIEKESIKNISYSDMIYRYVDYYKEFLGLDNAISYGLKHLTLIDYSYRPEYFKVKNSKSFNEGIYRILFAPIFKHQLQSEEICSEILEKQVYRYSQNYNLYANYDRLISCLGKNFEKDAEDQLLFNGVSKDDLKEGIFDTEQIYRITLESNITAIEDILIEKMQTDLVNYTQWDINMPMWKLLDNQILETEAYIDNYYKSFYHYESLMRLRNFILEKCEGYLNFKVIHERKTQIEKVLVLKKEKAIYRATLVGPLLTILLTGLLSYSSIESITTAFSIEEWRILIYLIVNIAFDTFLVIIFKSQFQEVFSVVKKQVTTNKLKKPIRRLLEFIKKKISKYNYFFL